MHGQRLGLLVLHQAKQGADAAKADADHISAEPLMPPNPANFTVSSGGILMSASPANALVARVNRQNTASAHNEIFGFFHKKMSRAEANKAPLAANHFLAKNSPKIELD